MEQNGNNKKREFWKPEPMTFSVFDKGVTTTEPKGVMDPYAVYTYIRDGISRYQTERLRGILDAAELKKYKQSEFETAVFSGVYSHKCDAGLVKPSGYVCIDIDHVPVQQTKDVLMGLEQFETVLMFTSPSGHGVKWVLNNRTLFSHVDFYSAVSNFLRDTCKIEVDMTARPLSHGCLLPWDPEVYLNPNYM